MPVRYVAEPFRIKSVEPLRRLTQAERDRKIAEAHFNIFNLQSRDVYIDMLTDSGTGAMSTEQWSAMMRGDEAYAGATSYQHLMATVKELYDYAYVQPVHQGRAAEHVLFPLLLGPGKVAISNTFFDTTRAHVELAGARCIDCALPQAADSRARVAFKGNMDTRRLVEEIEAHGADKVGVIVMTATNNSVGGQPVSMQNMRDTAEIARRYHIPLCIDAARYAENAFFIQRDEAAYRGHDITAIVREMFGLADLFTMSAKKDGLVNMGGLLGVRDPESPLIQQIRTRCIAYEGFVTYGGLNGRDLDALAVGLREALDEDYLRYRIGQTEYLASKLDEVGVPYQQPPGGHGIFLDAAAMFPQIPYTEFPAQTLVIEMYRAAGIRGVEVGSLLLGNDPDTGKQLKAGSEFARLAIPRRVYTQAHLDVIADALADIKSRAAKIRRGYRITWEPPVLRHFQAHLEPIEPYF
ncbi:MAG TPA: tryptophanase [Nevskiaceae bacterium]